MLSADDVETAFVETAREQQNGEPFNWQRLTTILNERLADAKDKALRDRQAFFGGNCSPTDQGRVG